MQTLHTKDMEVSMKELVIGILAGSVLGAVAAKSVKECKILLKKAVNKL